MHYKTQSAITIGAILVFMISIAFFINQMDINITGAVIGPVCECASDIDCDDNDPCTEDICVYPESCAASICSHKEIEGCN